MKRNLKALGLAMVAAFAFCAVAASAASAQGKITSDGPVTLRGTETGAALQNSLTAFGTNVTCDSLYTGHQIGSKTALIPSGSNTATITPHYTACTSPDGPKTVDMNGCDYVFHVGTAVGAGTYPVTADVVCPPGAVIEVTGPPCDVTVGPQNGLVGAHLTNGANGHVNLVGTFKNINLTACHFLPGTGELHVDVTIEGRNAVNLKTPISISG